MSTNTTQLTVAIALILAATVGLCADGAPVSRRRPQAIGIVHSAPDISAPTVATLTTTRRSGFPSRACGSRSPCQRTRRVSCGSTSAWPKQAIRTQKRACAIQRDGRHGRTTETAGVRGLNESDLKSAAFDAAQSCRSSRID
jgi:hypothetical protein